MTEFKVASLNVHGFNNLIKRKKKTRSCNINLKNIPFRVGKIVADMDGRYILVTGKIEEVKITL